MCRACYRSWKKGVGLIITLEIEVKCVELIIAVGKNGKKCVELLITLEIRAYYCRAYYGSPKKCDLSLAETRKIEQK